jgi:hypothetical protein
LLDGRSCSPPPSEQLAFFASLADLCTAPDPNPDPFPAGQTLHASLCALLCGAVRAGNPNKNELVKAIMSLDNKCQAALMQIISGSLSGSQSPSSPQPASPAQSTPSKTPTKPLLGTPETPFSSPPPRPLLSTPSPSPPASNKALAAERERSAALQKELDSLRQRHAAESMAVDITQLEAHEALVEGLRLELGKAKAENASLRPLREENEGLAATLATLRDDLDVATHSSAKLPAVELQLASALQRLEALLPMKQQLEELQGKHAGTLDELLRVEKEAATLPKLKKQLDEYRKKASEVEIERVRRERSEASEARRARAKRSERERSEASASEASASEESTRVCAKRARERGEHNTL